MTNSHRYCCFSSFLQSTMFTRRLLRFSHSPLLWRLPHSHSPPPSSFSHSLSTTSAGGGDGGDRVLGIRREESSVWERRAPLSPNHVQTLVSRGVKVHHTLSPCSSVTLLCVVYVALLASFFLPSSSLINMYMYIRSSLPLQVVIQPSSRRAYTAKEYRAAGAVVSDDLSQADAIFGTHTYSHTTCMLSIYIYIYIYI